MSGRDGTRFARRLLAIHGRDWMFIEQVAPNAADFVGAIKINALLVIQRDERHVLTNKNRFSLMKQSGALLRIHFGVGLANQGIVARIIPAGAVVAVV